MNTYFKYTNGESFTLEGNDYIGPFHIVDGVVYTGIFSDEDSLELTKKSTFLGDLYSNLYEFDNTYKNITGIIPNYTNSLDTLDKQGIDKLLLSIDNNNMACMKGMIISNPTIFNYEDGQSHFYGLGDGDSDNPINVPFKREYADILPFSETNNWGFLDSITVGTLNVDTYENFKYICADENATYILSGSFVEETPLALLSKTTHEPFYNITHQIHNDVEASKMLFVKNDFIEVYDTSNYNTCNQLILVDKIALIPTDTEVYIWDEIDQNWDTATFKWEDAYFTENDNNPEFIKFGKNIRTSVANNILYVINKYSDDVYQSINLSNNKIYTILDLDVRSVDDKIIILHKNSSGELFISTLDPTDSQFTHLSDIKSIDTDRPNQRVRFSNIDSNIFYTLNDKELQTRFISNSEYPSGRIDSEGLSYPKNYIWDEIDEFWNFMPIHWNSKDWESNNFNNILMSTNTANNKMYMLLHNVGRIYALNQPISNILKGSIPLNLEKYFTNPECSESSLGLYLNTYFSNVLKDIVNMLNKNFGKFTLEERKAYLTKINDIGYDTHNLYLNGNETVNVIPLQRILNLIVDIQRKLLPSSS